MQKDQHASNICIPSVFVSYAAGSRILQSLQRSGPWNPVKLTLSNDGERACCCVVSMQSRGECAVSTCPLTRFVLPAVPSSKASNSLLKRVVAYVFLVSAVCVFSRYALCSLLAEPPPTILSLSTIGKRSHSRPYATSSGLSLISSAIFRFIGKRRRTRASRKLPVITYRPNLQQLLLQELLQEQNVIDHIALADLGCSYDGDSGHVRESYGLDHTLASCHDYSDEEACAICLDDFAVGVDVKVRFVTLCGVALVLKADWMLCAAGDGGVPFEH